MVPLSHVKAIIIQTRYSRFAIVIKLVRKDLRGYHLLWPDLPTFSEFLEEGRSVDVSLRAPTLPPTASSPPHRARESGGPSLGLGAPSPFFA